MIIVQLLGGLGNQMFQYALGRRLAHDFKTSLCVDCHLLEDRTPGRHEVNRDFALDIFSGSIARASAVSTVPYSPWAMPRLLRPLARTTGITKESRITKERFFGFDKSVLNSGPNAYLVGLWQSIQYFEPIESLLKEDFRFRHPILPAASGVASAIRQSNSVCLHVRRTDFITHQTSTSPLGFVGLDYYRAGVQQILERERDAEFFVFSDDLDWCKKELTFVPRTTFVPAEYSGFKDSTHLKLMSSCRTFLIPNSTYSWWAAWISDHPEKTVYVPDQWFRDPTIDSAGFYPAGWQRLKIDAFSQTQIK